LAKSTNPEESMAIRSTYDGIIVNLERNVGLGGGTIEADERMQQVFSQFLTRREKLLISKPNIAQPGETANPRD